VTFEELRESLAEVNDEAILFDGFEDALVGIADRFGMASVALYDRNKMVEVLMQDGLTHEDAVEYLDFNVFGLWAGDHTPVIATFPATCRVTQ
jgi:hypothetical protein